VNLFLSIIESAELHNIEDGIGMMCKYGACKELKVVLAVWDKLTSVPQSSILQGALGKSS
jgi:hypothetical protein